MVLGILPQIPLVEGFGLESRETTVVLVIGLLVRLHVCMGKKKTEGDALVWPTSVPTARSSARTTTAAFWELVLVEISVPSKIHG